jgi:hypothetical protein
MDIADTRLNPQHAADLRWYWNDYPGECGERSALGGQLDRLREGRVQATSANVPDVDDRRILAVARARPIERRLARLSPPVVATLRAAFGPGLPETVRGYAGLGTTSLPASLMLLTAYRLAIPRDEIRRWLHELPALPPPDLTGLHKSAHAATLRRHAEAERHRQEQREAQIHKHLLPIRAAAQAALTAASRAYADVCPRETP